MLNISREDCVGWSRETDVEDKGRAEDKEGSRKADDEALVGLSWDSGFYSERGEGTVKEFEQSVDTTRPRLQKAPLHTVKRTQWQAVMAEGGLEWEGTSVVIRKPILDLFLSLLSPCLCLCFR